MLTLGAWLGFHHFLSVIPLKIVISHHSVFEVGPILFPFARCFFRRLGGVFVKVQSLKVFVLVSPKVVRFLGLVGLLSGFLEANFGAYPISLHVP